jgi:hypothetical protein
MAKERLRIVRDAVDDAGPYRRDPDSAGTCPVVALGHQDGEYVFLSPSGELRRLKARDLGGAPGLVSLFGGDLAWMKAAHPRYDREGNPVDDFNARAVMADLVRQCEAKGLFDPGLKMRGLGVWPAVDGARRVAVAHCGKDLVVVDEMKRPSTRPAGWHVARQVFVARPVVPGPDTSSPASVADGEELRDALRLWRWGRNDVDVWLMLGFVGASLMGALSPFRSHGQLDAEHGSGKTTLLQLIQAVLGCMGELWNDYSEAGLRATLGGDARTVLLDEADPTPGSGADGGSLVQRVIGLLRRMSTGDGANVVRGSPTQDAHRSTVTGSALLASVNPPPLTPQDRSRIYRFRLRKATGDPEAAKAVAVAIAKAAEMSPRFRGRALIMWPVFERTQSAFRHALITSGADGRQADLLSVMSAGACMLVCDELPDGPFIEQIVQDLALVVREAAQADTEDADAAQCLNRMMSAPVDSWRTGTRPTVGQLVSWALDDPHGTSAGELKKIGLRVDTNRLAHEAADAVPVLLVAYRHQGLARIFAGDSRWAGGGWVGSLERLGEDVAAHPSPVRFAGALSRALRIPLRHLPPAEEAEPIPPPGTHDEGAL